MEFVSNESFQDNEFQKWREDVMLGGTFLPTLKELEVKSKDITDAVQHKLSNKEINHMIREKERFMENPRNYAMYKNRLAKERIIAAAEGNQDEADWLTPWLAELEERAEHLDRARSEKISSIALINDRNRKRNIEKAEENIKQEIEKKKIERESCDPFTRQKTKPILATSVIKKAEGDPSLTKPVTALKPKVVADPKAKDDKSKLKEDKMENEPTSADLFSAHDFDIKIDLGAGTPNSVIKLNLMPVGSVKPDNGPKKSLNFQAGQWAQEESQLGRLYKEAGTDLRLGFNLLFLFQPAISTSTSLWLNYMVSIKTGRA